MGQNFRASSRQVTRQDLAMVSALCVSNNNLHDMGERNKRKHGESTRLEQILTQFIDKQTRNRLSTIRGSGDRRYDQYIENSLLQDNLPLNQI